VRQLSGDSVHRRNSAYCKQFRWLGAGRCAGRADEREIDGKKNGLDRGILIADKVADAQMENINIERAGRIVLNPLTEVGIGVLVSIVISSCQLVMDILRHGKRRNGKQ
jgi:hypothetical protein